MAEARGACARAGVLSEARALLVLLPSPATPLDTSTRPFHPTQLARKSHPARACVARSGVACLFEWCVYGARFPPPLLSSTHTTPTPPPIPPKLTTPHNLMSYHAAAQPPHTKQEAGHIAQPLFVVGGGGASTCVCTHCFGNL